MSSRVTAVIFLLVAALLIQNTCPRGFAGKSAVASACSHCPHKQVHRQPLEASAFGIIAKAPHLPLFVLDIPDTQPSFRLASVSVPQPVIPNTYKNSSPDELLHPPRA